ncbi:hypothetical protein D3C85_1571190 [compost metagenome]
MVTVYNNIKEGKYSQRYLDALKKDHRDGYYRHQESASSIVEDLGEAEVLGSYTLVEDMVPNFNKVYERFFYQIPERCNLGLPGR